MNCPHIFARALCITLYLLIGAVISDKPLGRRQVVPVFHVRGSHYDIGFDTGRTFGQLIKSFISSCDRLRDFEKEYATPAGRVAYDTTLNNMRERFPYYVKEIQGVSDGAGVPFHQLFLLQMDDIIDTVNDKKEPKPDAGGCTSIGINLPGNGILGHTEDAFTETLNHFYILSAHVIPTPEDAAHGAVEERFSSLCYAGHLPGYTMGFNQNGLVFSINTLSVRNLKPGYTPRTFITRAVLAAKNLTDAKRILLDEGLGIGNGFSINMLWSDREGNKELYNAEVAPDPEKKQSLINIQKYDKEPLVHCNLYQRINVTEMVGPIIDSSIFRLNVIKSHTVPTNRGGIEKILSDSNGKDFQIFQQKPDSIIKTIAAGIFDIERKTWSIYIDKPDSSEPVAVLPIVFKSFGESLGGGNDNIHINVTQY